MGHETNQGSPGLEPFIDDVVVDVWRTILEERADLSEGESVVAPPVTFSLMFCSASVMATASTSAFVSVSFCCFAAAARGVKLAAATGQCAFLPWLKAALLTALLLRRPRFLVAPRVGACFLADHCCTVRCSVVCNELAGRDITATLHASSCVSDDLPSTDAVNRSVGSKNRRQPQPFPLWGRETRRRSGKWWQTGP